MSGDSRWELQQAVRSALLANATLTNIVGSNGVYDDVPEHSENQNLYPYLVIGEMNAIDSSDKSENGIQVTLVLYAWSVFRGYKEIYQILSAAYDVVHYAQDTLTVSGQNVIQSRFLSSEVFRVEDGLSRFGIARYLIETCPV